MMTTVISRMTALALLLAGTVPPCPAVSAQAEAAR